MLEIKTPGSLPFPQRLIEKEHYGEIYNNHNANHTYYTTWWYVNRGFTSFLHENILSV